MTALPKYDPASRAVAEAKIALAKAPHRLKRETFKTSRLLDFCSERELTKQIGHGADQWPLVILKENSVQLSGKLQ
jgi:hypothetical protein